MSVTAVIPVRYRDCFTEAGASRMNLAGRPLWQVTLEQALAAKKIGRVIVAYDDDRFEAALAPWMGKIMLCKRPPTLSEAGKTTVDVLAFVAGWLLEQGLEGERLMLLEITHPLRPGGIIDQIAGADAEHDMDTLITCHRMHYNFWRRDSRGEMTRVQGSGDGEGVEMFQELVGICSIFGAENLRSDDPYGCFVDIVPIDMFWATIDVRDADGLWLAEQYLARTGTTV